MTVSVSGVGFTKFGELWDRDLRSLGVEAAEAALRDANVDASDIDAVFVANMAGETFTGQAHLGAVFTEALALSCAGFRVEGACASGGLAVNLGYTQVLSGRARHVLVVGVEKMTDMPLGELTQGLMGAAEEESEGFAGATFPALYALIAREHFRMYGSSPEDLARVAVKNHEYGSHNPIAQFRSRITIDDVLNASRVADPLGLLDCSAVSDGAAAVVLSSERVPYRPEIVASQVGHDTVSLAKRADLTTLASTVTAADAAYREAAIEPDDVDIAEVHDCFSIAELLAYEDLGFVPKGKGHAYADLDPIPVNTSGGLKACGHPVGATGVKQVAEIALQLRGDAGARQVESALNYGLAHNVGGSGGTAVVTVMRRF